MTTIQKWRTRGRRANRFRRGWTRLGRQEFLIKPCQSLACAGHVPLGCSPCSLQMREKELSLHGSQLARMPQPMIVDVLGKPVNQLITSSRGSALVMEQATNPVEKFGSRWGSIRSRGHALGGYDGSCGAHENPPRALDDGAQLEYKNHVLYKCSVVIDARGRSTIYGCAAFVSIAHVEN